MNRTTHRWLMPTSWLLIMALGAAGQQPAARRPGPPPEVREKLKQFGRGEGVLKPGDPATDFTLPVLKSDKQVTLSSFRGKRPVALVFGSYT